METKNKNIHQKERLACVGLGGALFLWSLSRRAFAWAALAAALLYRGVSGHSFLYQILGVSTAQKSGADTNDSATNVVCAITVGRPAEELYRIWRDPRSLSQLHMLEAREGEAGRIHWRMDMPFGKSIKWESQFIEERPGELLRWRSVEGTRVPSEGSLRFQPAPRDWGTEVTLQLSFTLPGGTLSNSIAKRLGFAPRMFAENVLRRLKSYAETGEIPTLVHNPAARSEAYASSSAH